MSQAVPKGETASNMAADKTVGATALKEPKVTKGAEMSTDNKHTKGNKMSNNSPIEQSYIQEKSILNDDKSASKFLVLVSPAFEHKEWISYDKFIDLNALFSDSDEDSLSYSLRNTQKMDRDNGKDGTVGKAIRLSEKDDDMLIEIFTQTYKESWKYSHEHFISKTLYDSYLIVMHNNIAMNKLDKEIKNASKTNMTLVR